MRLAYAGHFSPRSPYMKSAADDDVDMSRFRPHHYFIIIASRRRVTARQRFDRRQERRVACSREEHRLELLAENEVARHYRRH